MALDDVETSTSRGLSLAQAITLDKCSINLGECSASELQRVEKVAVVLRGSLPP